MHLEFTQLLISRNDVTGMSDGGGGRARALSKKRCKCVFLFFACDSFFVCVCFCLCLFLCVFIYVCVFFCLCQQNYDVFSQLIVVVRCCPQIILFI